MVKDLCQQTGVAPPLPEQVTQLFQKCDKSRDGVLHVAEFTSFYRILLEDLMKMQSRSSGGGTVHSGDGGSGAPALVKSTRPAALSHVSPGDAAPAALEPDTLLNPKALCRFEAENLTAKPIMVNVHYIDRRCARKYAVFRDTEHERKLVSENLTWQFGSSEMDGGSLDLYLPGTITRDGKIIVKAYNSVRTEFWTLDIVLEGCDYEAKILESSQAQTSAEDLQKLDAAV